jgi:hypothetical protein
MPLVERLWRKDKIAWDQAGLPAKVKAEKQVGLPAGVV